MDQLRHSEAFEDELSQKRGAFNCDWAKAKQIFEDFKVPILHSLHVTITMLKSREQHSWSYWNSKKGFEVCPYIMHCLLCWPSLV